MEGEIKSDSYNEPISPFARGALETPRLKSQFQMPINTFLLLHKKNQSLSPIYSLTSWLQQEVQISP